ncbi:MAG: ATP-binding protein, partial [Acidimicrobiia bacterium]
LGVSPGQPFPEPDQRLLEQVAAGLGLALRNLLLTEDLRARVGELAASRRRIVSVQDETRRKLERDLHDGAQQRLVALKIKLGIGSSMAGKAGLPEIKALIDGIRDETDHTIETVRDFARGIYPPLLEAEGLGAAVSAQARKMQIPVTVQAAGLGRFSRDQEAAVYFCVLEALQNAMKHSKARSVQVVITGENDELGFVVRDDGIGFEQGEADGSGLINMSDRLDALGGVLEMGTAPGRGTEIRGRLPIGALMMS